MLSRMLGEPPPPERTAPKRPREAPAAQPLRRSGRERKEVSYVAPRITPLSGLILSAFESLGEKAKDGLPWPTLAALVRPNFEGGDPRIDGLFQASRTAVQSLLKQGKLRRKLATTAEDQEEALSLPAGSRDRTIAALRAMVMQAAQVPEQALGRWDVPLPSEEEAQEQAEAEAKAEAEQLRQALAKELSLREQGGLEEEEIVRRIEDAKKNQPAEAATPWLPPPDLLPELGASGNGNPMDVIDDDGGGSDGEWDRPPAAADTVRELVDTTPGCRVELVVSLASIKNRLARQSDASFFACPPGWIMVADESRSGRRRTQMVYTRQTEPLDRAAAEEEEEEDMVLNRHVTTKVLRMMRELKSDESSWPFLDPVPVDATPGYAELVPQPMDLTTVQRKLDHGEYLTLNALSADLRLIPANCLRFNARVGELDPGFAYVEAARTFERQVNKGLASVRGGDVDAGVVRHRSELEEKLEKEWAAAQPGRAPAAWLGQVVQGSWEINAKLMLPALEEIVSGLVADGLMLPVELGGIEGGRMVSKAGVAKRAAGAKKKAKKGDGGGGGGKAAKLGYVVANKYTVGEAFKLVDARAAEAARLAAGGDATAATAEAGAAAAAAAAAAEEEEEEELNEYELERARNIMRNQEFLKSLGLA